jgi:hypothetical protein
MLMISERVGLLSTDDTRLQIPTLWRGPWSPANAFKPRRKHAAQIEYGCPTARRSNRSYPLLKDNRRRPPSTQQAVAGGQRARAQQAISSAARQFRVIWPAWAEMCERGRSGSMQERQAPIVSDHDRGKVLSHGTGVRIPVPIPNFIAPPVKHCKSATSAQD